MCSASTFLLYKMYLNCMESKLMKGQRTFFKIFYFILEKIFFYFFRKWSVTNGVDGETCTNVNTASSTELWCNFAQIPGENKIIKIDLMFKYIFKSKILKQRPKKVQLMDKLFLK